MMNKKKLMIPIVLLLLFFVALLSGCIYNVFESPVGPYFAWQEGSSGDLHLMGFYSSTYCEANMSTPFFVYDTKKHDNWEDYSFSAQGEQLSPLPYIPAFHTCIPFNKLEVGVRYHWRAVAYCYNLTDYYNGWEDGWYSSPDRSIKIREAN